jgi:hypothetical protein
MVSRAGNLIGETTSGTDQVLLYDRASFQPDEWIRRDRAPYRGQGLFIESVQRIEQTVKFGFTNVCFVAILNYGTVADRFLFQAPANVAGGLDARYFLQPAGAEITAAVTNAGWTSDLVSVCDTREVRVQITPHHHLAERDQSYLHRRTRFSRTGRLGPFRGTIRRPI